MLKMWKFVSSFLCRRITILGFCGILYLSLWTSYFYFNGTVTDSNGDEIPLHEAIHHFFTSPFWTDLKQSLYDTYVYAQHHGWYVLFRFTLKLLRKENNRKLSVFGRFLCYRPTKTLQFVLGTKFGNKW